GTFAFYCDEFPKDQGWNNGTVKVELNRFDGILDFIVKYILIISDRGTWNVTPHGIDQAVNAAIAIYDQLFCIFNRLLIHHIGNNAYSLCTEVIGHADTFIDFFLVSPDNTDFSAGLSQCFDKGFAYNPSASCNNDNFIFYGEFI